MGFLHIDLNTTEYWQTLLWPQMPSHVSCHLSLSLSLITTVISGSPLPHNPYKAIFVVVIIIIIALLYDVQCCLEWQLRLWNYITVDLVVCCWAVVRYHHVYPFIYDGTMEYTRSTVHFANIAYRICMHAVMVWGGHWKCFNIKLLGHIYFTHFKSALNDMKMVDYGQLFSSFSLFLSEFPSYLY